MVVDLIETENGDRITAHADNRKFSTEEKLELIARVGDAVQHAHLKGVIHRDLKLGNLFISNKMEIKLGDFGLATKLDFDGEKKRTICGTPNYIAPEVIEGKTGGVGATGMTTTASQSAVTTGGIKLGITSA